MKYRITEAKGFAGGDRRVWIYIYRVMKSASETIIENYIKAKPDFAGSSILVKEIPSKEGTLKSFVIVAPLEKKDELYKTFDQKMLLYAVLTLQDTKNF